MTADESSGPNTPGQVPDEPIEPQASPGGEPADTPGPVPGEQAEPQTPPGGEPADTAGQAPDEQAEPQTPPGGEPADQSSQAASAEPASPEPQTEEADQAESRLKLTARVDDLGPCKKRLHVEIDRSHVEKKLSEALDNLVETAMVPGFRPGRAPRALVGKRFRREMANQVKGELVAAAFEQALEEQDLTLLGQPDMKLEDIQLPDDGPLTFESEIEVRPQFDIPQYDQVEITRPRVEVTDQQIDEAIESLRDRGARLVPKGDEPAEAGDALVADLTLTLADRTIKEDRDVDLRVEPTVRLADVSLQDFQDAMVGVHAGEQRVCEATMSEHYEQADLQGKSVQCTVSVKDVKRVDRPELDEPMLAQMGFASVEELREEVSRSLERRLQRDSLSACRQQVYDHLLKQAEWDLPRDLVDRETERLAARRRLDLMMAGVSEAQIDEHTDALMASSHERAVRQLKAYFILDKIAQKEGVTVEPGDIDTQIAALASRFNESPRRVRARLEKQERMGLLEIQVLEQKTVDRILQDATFTDASFEQYNQQHREDAEPATDAAPDAAPGPAPDAAPGHEPSDTDTQSDPTGADIPPESDV